MSEDKKLDSPGRRAFFRNATLGLGAAGAALAGATSQSAEAKTPSADKEGYRLTQHIKKVYELARF